MARRQHPLTLSKLGVRDRIRAVLEAFARTRAVLKAFELQLADRQGAGHSWPGLSRPQGVIGFAFSWRPNRFNRRRRRFPPGPMLPCSRRLGYDCRLAPRPIAETGPWRT
jgi:hypothetical protein